MHHRAGSLKEKPINFIVKNVKIVDFKNAADFPWYIIFLQANPSGSPAPSLITAVSMLYL